MAIVCCDMQSEDGMAQTLLWKNFNVITVKNSVPIVNFKGFMADNVHANWNTMRKDNPSHDQGLNAHVFSFIMTCIPHYHPFK